MLLPLLKLQPSHARDIRYIISSGLRKLTRRRCLHNRTFAHLDDVMHAVESQFAHWIKPNETLRNHLRRSV
jgi:hypothetical protein